MVTVRGLEKPAIEHFMLKYLKLISLFGSGHTDETRLYSRLALRKQDYMFIVTSCTVEYTHTHKHTITHTHTQLRITEGGGRHPSPYVAMYSWGNVATSFRLAA